uniref:Uncharacterized protein n=2 Tax=Oryza meridionalis TaxID=40149 RepID=A0A0E0F2H2_9ORYZ
MSSKSSPRELTGKKKRTKHDHEALRFIELAENGTDRATIDASEGRTILHIAVPRNSGGYFGHVLAKLEPSIDMKDNLGLTLLQLSILLGKYAAMQKLIDFGADIHIHSLYGGPIHAAVALDDEIALEALMRKSVNVDDIIDGGITPLACAAYNGSVTSMKTLLQAGANVQISKPIGKAIVANLTSSESMVQILLDSGANADAIDEVMFEDPPIIAAAKRKQMNVVQLLLSSSTPIEGVDWSLNGRCPYSSKSYCAAPKPGCYSVSFLKALRNDVSTTEWDRLRNLNLLYLSHSFHGQKPVLSSDAIVNMALVYQKQDKGKEVMCLKAALALNPQNERAESLLRTALTDLQEDTNTEAKMKDDQAGKQQKTATHSAAVPPATSPHRGCCSRARRRSRSLLISTADELLNLLDDNPFPAAANAAAAADPATPA